ncbi:hypothetical protein X801_05539, partial [Opisthorchis viverrini]
MDQKVEFESPVVLHARKTSSSPVSSDRTVPALRPPNVSCPGDDFTPWSFGTLREVQGAKAIIRRVRGPVFGKPQGSRSKKLRGGRQNIDRGVSHPGLKAELIRHPPDNICDAIQLARSYEATLELEPQLHALKITADPGPRQLPPGNRNNRPRNRMNPYRCVHNPPIRPTGDPLSFCNLVPIISHISHSTPPLRISGYPDKRPVRFLVDTGASCSVRVVHRPKQWEQRYFLSASGDQFYCAPVIWEAILGMGFLKKYESSIDFTSGQITFDNPCQPNPDVLSQLLTETTWDTENKIGLLEFEQTEIYIDTMDFKQDPQ